MPLPQYCLSVSAVQGNFTWECLTLPCLVRYSLTLPCLVRYNSLQVHFSAFANIYALLPLLQQPGLTWSVIFICCRQKDPAAAEAKLSSASSQYASFKKDYDRSRGTVTRTGNPR